MGRVNLRYVQTFTDRTGRLRAYFRFQGKRWSLPHPDDPAFLAEYQRLMRTVAGQVAATDRGEDSLGWLIKAYQASPEFKKLGERTQAEYRRILSDIGLAHGTKSWSKLTRPLVMAKIRDPLAETPRKADLTVSILSAVYSWAVKREIARENPCRGIERLYEAGEGHRAWTAAEIEAFCAGCDEEEWLIFLLALYTALRASDLAKLSWFTYDGARITVTTGKTKARVVIPVHPALKAELDGRPRSAGTILARPDGRPYTQNALSKRFSRALHRLALDVSLHGLRTTHAALLAEAGVGSRQIQATTTHATLEMVERYTRNAEQARMAADSIARLPNVSRTAGGKSR